MKTQKSKQDALFPYTKLTLLVDVVIGVCLAAALLMAVINSAYYQTHMWIPVVATLFGYGILMPLLIRPSRFLPMFDAKLGVKPEWVNGRSANVLLLWLFYVLPMLIVMSMLLAGLYKPVYPGASPLMGDPPDIPVQSSTNDDLTYLMAQHDVALTQLRDAGTNNEYRQVEAYYQEERMADAKGAQRGIEAKRRDECRAAAVEAKAELVYWRERVDTIESEMEAVQNQQDEATASQDETAGRVYYAPDEAMNASYPIRTIRVMKSFLLTFLGYPVFIMFVILSVYDKHQYKKQREKKEKEVDV